VNASASPPVNQDIYEPRGGSRALFSCRDLRVLVEGPAATGKTRGILEYVVYNCSKYPGSRHWIGRQTRESMTESVLVTLETKVLKPGMAAYAAVAGQARAHRQSYTFPNGSVIVVGGLDKPEKTFSAEYDTMVVFEAIEAIEGDCELLLRCLRNNVMPYQQQIMDTNPGYPGHWLNRAANEGRVRRILSRHEDNPYLFDQGKWTKEGVRVIAALDALTGPRRQRLRYGKWVSAEGAVYEAFDQAVHVIDAMPKGWESWRKLRSIDFGYTNPFVCQWWAIDPDGRMYLYREIYRSQRIVADHAKDILRLSAGEVYDTTISDHDAEDRATLQREGIDTVPAKKDVTPGLQAVADRLRVQPDGKPRLFLLRSALVERDHSLEERKAPCSTAQEFEGYIYAPNKEGKPIKEEPLKVDDHGMDAMRYAAMQFDGGGGISVSVVEHSGKAEAASADVKRWSDFFTARDIPD
jgi:PBSX family phage terminase large subunit